ncbi:tumor necrosis factor receptor superfamily member 19 [Lissotriton helveticus]
MDCEAFERKGQILKLLILLVAYMSCTVNCETGDCREQEFMDHSGKCIPCKQCGPGQELSKECGFGYQEDAQCMTCRPNRFKEDWGFQKCKPCQDCALVNRYLKANCSATSNTACGDCLPGFYRKTKLGGFQDMECVPCGDPPPPYEPHCHTKVNLVKIPSTASSPRDTALAAVICSALSTVLLALLILCIIYCKRQFMEKPTWSARAQDVQCKGAELSCFDRQRIIRCSQRPCHQCPRDLAQACGPVHLIPSLLCEESCSLQHNRTCCSFHSESTLHERNPDSLVEMIPPFLGSTSHFARRELAEIWPLMGTPSDRDATPSCESHEECIEEPGSHASIENEDAATMSLDCDQTQRAGLSPALSYSEESLEPAGTPEDHEYQDTPLQTEQAVQHPSTENFEAEVKVSQNNDSKEP